MTGKDLITIHSVFRKSVDRQRKADKNLLVHWISFKHLKQYEYILLKNYFFLEFGMTALMFAG